MRLRTVLPLALLGIAPPVLAQQEYASPHWSITMSDYGYSDFIEYTAGAFPPGWIHEMISGEWGAAIAYDGIPLTLPERAMWLEPEWVYPNWTTNSNFTVIQPLDFPQDLDADGLPEGSSVIANADVEITISLDVQDTVSGTPMGEGTGSVASSRYVLLTTYTIKNLRATTLTGVRFFQFLHGHPANDETSQVRAFYDTTTYAGPLQDFRYDVTQFSTSSGAIDGSPTGCTFRDHIGFSTEIAPADFGLGPYRDHVVRPATGLHVDVEQDILGNQTTFGPDQVAGATRIDLGSIAAGATKSVRVLLSFRSDDLSPNLSTPAACVRIQPGAGTDPEIRVDRGACVSPSPSTTPWDVISGNLESLVEGGGIVTMGTVECIASKVLVDRVTDVSPLSDCRRGVFLLARQSLPFNNYGTSSAGSIRFPGPGDCPP